MPRSWANWLVPLLLLACGPRQEAHHHLRIELDVELGDDLGQPLGTLFELRAGERIVAAAGAQQLNGTHLSNNGRVLAFFVGNDASTTVEPIGNPFPEMPSHTRLFNWRNTLYALSRAPMPAMVRKLTPTGTWEDAPDLLQQLGDRVRNLEVVNDRLLVFHDKAITYDGDTIHHAPDIDHLIGIYRNGRVLVHHFSGTDDPDRFLLAAWDPGRPTTFTPLAWHDDPSPMPSSGFIYCMTQHGPHFLVGTNFGAVYRINEGELTTIYMRQPEDPSWQPYCFLSMDDEVLIGHYPSGQLLSYTPSGIAWYEPPLPVPAWAPKINREAQSLALYGGSLFCGVWPWGELHEMDLEDRTWKTPQRLFAHPEVEEAIPDHLDAPYVAVYQQRPEGTYDNAWGQRITGFIQLGPYLYASTSNKGSRGYAPQDSTVITDAALAEYGQVHRILRPGALSAQITWKPRTTLTFHCNGQGITMLQDGDTLMHANTGVDIPWRPDELQLRTGSGLYGTSQATTVLRTLAVQRSRSAQ